MNNNKNNSRKPILVDEDWKNGEANNMVKKLKKAIEDLGTMAKNRDEKNGTRRFYEQTLTKVWRWTIGATVTLIIIPIVGWTLLTVISHAMDIERVETTQENIVKTLKRLETGINNVERLQQETLEKVNDIDKNNAVVESSLSDHVINAEKDLDRIERRLDKLEH